MSEQPTSSGDTQREPRSLVGEMASQIAAAFLRRRLREGKSIEIPSIGITVQGSSEGNQPKPSTKEE